MLIPSSFTLFLIALWRVSLVAAPQPEIHSGVSPLPIIRFESQKSIVAGRGIRVLDAKATPLYLGGQLPHAVRNANDSLWKTTKEDNPNFGFRSEPVWVQCVVQNPHPEVQDWLMEIAYPTLDSVQISVVSASDSVHTVLMGDHLPFRQRAFQHRYFILPLTFADTLPHTIYIGVHTGGSVQFPITFYRSQEFTEQTIGSEIFYGVFYGILLALIVYNSFIALSLASWTYGRYVLHFTIVLLSLLILNGHGVQYFLRDSPWLANILIPCLLSFGSGVLLLFAKAFLRVRAFVPWAEVAMSIFAYICFATSVASFIVPYRIIIFFATAESPSSILVCVIVGLFAWWRGSATAKYLVVALIILVFGTFINVWKVMGIVPNNNFTTHSIEVGFAAEGLLLAFALANQYRLLRMEKERVQAEAFQAQQQAKELLEVKVRQRTQELEQSNEAIQRQVSILDDQARTIEIANTVLQEKNLLLEEMDKEKDEFLGIAAHDLKNPLAHIIMSAGTIVRYYDRMSDEEIQYQIQSVGMVAMRMKEIISNILDINALERGGIRVVVNPFEIPPKVHAVIQDYTARAAEKQLRISTEIMENVPLVNADESIILQVLDNLVSNAVKYSPPNTTIILRVKSTTDAVRVEIQDEGPGISPDDMTKLFGKFARLSARPTGGEHSTGLGLSIVKKMVEAMNGRVWCESELGKGATFIVELPMANEETN